MFYDQKMVNEIDTAKFADVGCIFGYAYTYNCKEKSKIYVFILKIRVLSRIFQFQNEKFMVLQS